MGFPQPNRRFSTARDLAQMATMLDDYFLLLTKDIGLTYSNAVLPQEGKPMQGIRIGSLVQSNGNGGAQLADASEGIEATDVIVDVIGPNQVRLAPMALVNIPLDTELGSGIQRLYLGNNGRVVAEAPPDGVFTQEVGIVRNFNGQTNLYSCYISPGATAGASGGNEPLTPGAGISGGIYDGTIARTWSVSSNTRTDRIMAQIGNGVVTPPAGTIGWMYIPYDCEINSVTMLADVVGSAVMDIWAAPYSSYPPTIANSITAAAKPTISSAIKSQNTTLVGWTTTLAAGTTVKWHLDSCTTITRLVGVLDVTLT